MGHKEDVADIRETHGAPITTDENSMDIYLAPNFEGASMVVVQGEALVCSTLYDSTIASIIRKLTEIQQDRAAREKRATTTHEEPMGTGNPAAICVAMHEVMCYNDGGCPNRDRCAGDSNYKEGYSEEFMGQQYAQVILCSKVMGDRLAGYYPAHLIKDDPANKGRNWAEEKECMDVVDAAVDVVCMGCPLIVDCHKPSTNYEQLYVCVKAARNRALDKFPKQVELRSESYYDEGQWHLQVCGTCSHCNEGKGAPEDADSNVLLPCDEKPEGHAGVLPDSPACMKHVKRRGKIVEYVPADKFAKRSVLSLYETTVIDVFSEYFHRNPTADEMNAIFAHMGKAVERILDQGINPLSEIMSDAVNHCVQLDRRG